MIRKQAAPRRSLSECASSDLRTRNASNPALDSADPMKPTPSRPEQPSAALLPNPQRGARAYDELLDAEGRPRAHYGMLFGALEEFGLTELRHRRDACERLVGEQGITYNVYAEPRAVQRPWQLDLVPLIMDPEEWRSLEEGLIQRANLLNQILADCYGPQTLIHTRWLAPALVFAQPDFLRPCQGVSLPNRAFLHFYAADLARSADGRWWVVSDRTQIPTGMGYALANRVVTSRILPGPFRDNNVHRIAGFFRDVQDALAQLSPRGADHARVALLTPGPHNETYFEQAYLARYLGYTLVEGQDLTVRDDRLFLKTLSGLEPVDVVVRRVDDDYCDPLELRNDSILGVPGLLEAIRAGNVAVANALGSGLVQSPAFMAFLPGLCRHLLGEELKLPSVATWWCGQQPARQHVLGHLDDLAVKPAFRTHHRTPDPARNWSETERAEVARLIEFDPDLFVAQERIELSTAASLESGGLVSRPVGLRVFLVATPKGYRVMPGGLTRVAPDAGGRFISIQRGGSSKDTWLPSNTPVEEVSLLHGAPELIELRRTGNNLPSRLADNFFWLGRYAERADATARLLRSALRGFNPERGSGAQTLIAPLLQTLERQGQLPDLSRKPELRQNAEAFEAELLAAIFDPDRSGSLRHTADELQRLATQVRDRTSNDMWRALSRLNDRLARPAASSVIISGDAAAVLNEALLGLAALHGLARENMTRAQAWRFLDMGLRLERAVYLCTLLDATLACPDADNPSLLEMLLEVVDCSITFRSRYNLVATVPAVFDLILLDDKNPRSVLFQVRQLAKHFEKLPPERENVPGSGKNIVLKCDALLNRADPRDLARPRQTWAKSQIRTAIRETLATLPDLSNTIAATYFAHSAISRTGRGYSP